MQLRFLFLFPLLMCKYIFAQQVVDVRAMGCSYSTVAMPMNTGTLLNVAALTNQKQSFLEATVLNKYTIKELTAISAAYALKLNSNNSLLFGINRMGNNAFAEQFAEIGISKKLAPKFSAGLVLKYYNWRINDSHYSSSQALIPELALLINTLPSINFGVTIRNPVRSRMNATETQRLPAEINSGIAAIVSNKLTFTISAISETGNATSIRSGIEYKYVPGFILRAGYNSTSASYSFGTEFFAKNYCAVISIENHPLLGISSGITITFQL